MRTIQIITFIFLHICSRIRVEFPKKKCNLRNLQLPLPRPHPSGEDNVGSGTRLCGRGEERRLGNPLRGRQSKVLQLSHYPTCMSSSYADLLIILLKVKVASPGEGTGSQTSVHGCPSPLGEDGGFLCIGVLVYVFSEL